eukprot:scaffold359_cov42-Prasinocladus_malaysianus.AAC.1
MLFWERPRIPAAIQFIGSFVHRQQHEIEQAPTSNPSIAPTVNLRELRTLLLASLCGSKSGMTSRQVECQASSESFDELTCE